MKICPNCSKKNASTAKFCGGCGNSLENVSNVEPIAPSAMESTKPLPQLLTSVMRGEISSNTMRTLLLIALIVIAVGNVLTILHARDFFRVYARYLVDARVLFGGYFKESWNIFSFLLSSLGWIGFSIGCLFKSKIAAKVGAIIVFFARFVGAVVRLIFVYSPFLSFDDVLGIIGGDCFVPFGFALLAWISIPYVIAILDNKKNSRTT